MAHCPGDDVIKQQSKKFITYPFSNATHRKPRTQISKGFIAVQTTRLQESFYASNSSLTCSSGEVTQIELTPVGDSMHFLQFFDFGVQRFFGHNFGSRHARRPIKGSIDAGDHLVSKTILSQNFDSLDWRSGPVKFGQNFKNIHTL